MYTEQKKKYNSVEFQSNQVKVNASNQTYTFNLRLKKIKIFIDHALFKMRKRILFSSCTPCISDCV